MDRPTAHAPSRWERLRRDTGSVSLELALIAPMVVALLFLGVIAFRVASTQLGIDTAATNAARDASIQRTPSAAQAAAEATAAAMRPDFCTDYFIEVDTGGLEPGGTVTVTLTCTVDTSEIGALPTRTVTATAGSLVDQWRGTTP
jgi:Flp pilus assembly protein TadG